MTTPTYDLNDWPLGKKQPIVDTVRRFGLDASAMSAQNLSASGYDQFVLNGKGERIFSASDNTALRTRRSWPMGCWEQLEPLLKEAA